MFVILFEVVFLILFGIFVRYDHLGKPNEVATNVSSGSSSSSSSHGAEEAAKSTEHVIQFYAMFQDIHVMMFIGFGFLMTFLKRYGFSSVGLNFLLAAFVLQWATLTGGWIRHFDSSDNKIHVDLTALIGADFASAAVLISFGAVLGKLNALQLLVMAFIEVAIFQVNELIVFDKFHATDTGDSMVVHAFGAYFGLAVATIVHNDDIHSAELKEGSVYTSDLFSMIGTIFLWLYWPSFNAGTAVDQGQLRGVINTYYSLTASAIVTFALSSLVNKGKFHMVHVQNSTLAGGVAIGTLADLIIEPWAAILVGMVAGCVSVLGFQYMTPWLAKRFHIHDTCGVNNLHGMPGIISGLGSILAAGLATHDLYKDGRDKLFTETGRSEKQLAGYQAAALGVSLGFALVGGSITGVILRLPIFDQPHGEQLFDDEDFWVLPTDDHKSDASSSVGFSPVPAIVGPNKTMETSVQNTTLNNNNNNNNPNVVVLSDIKTETV